MLFSAGASNGRSTLPLSPSRKLGRKHTDDIAMPGMKSYSDQYVPLASEINIRLTELDHKLKEIDAHFRVMSGASAARLLKMDRKLDDMGHRLRELTPAAVASTTQEVPLEELKRSNSKRSGWAEQLPKTSAKGLQGSVAHVVAQLSPRGSLSPQLSPHGAPRSPQLSPAAVWTPQASPVSACGTARSEANLPLPVGDLLAVEAPAWEAIQVPTDVDLGLDFDGHSKFAGERCEKVVEEATEDTQSRRTAVNSALTSVKDLQERVSAHSPVRVKLWNFLDDPDSGVAARAYARTMPYVIFCSVSIALLQTADPPPIYGWVAVFFDVTFELLYLLEFVLRAVSCPTKRTFVMDYNNTIDFLAAAPILVRAIMGFAGVRGCHELGGLGGGDCSWIGTALTCTVPLLRAMKTLRRFETLPLLIDALDKASEGLPVCLFVLFVLILFFSPLIYLVEPRDNVESMPRAMWLTVVTMTTVGYGDITPVTTVGASLVTFLVILSVLYMAMPLGIVGNAFTEVWQERDFILLRHRTKAKFAQWGYTPHDVPALFMLFAEDGTGELNLKEFKQMMSQMRIGLNSERVIQLFEALDEDRGGSIDDQEFVKRVFPEAYSQLYELAKASSLESATIR